MIHDVRITAPDGFGDAVASCPCGWHTSQPCTAQAADQLAAQHMVDNRTPDDAGNSMVDFSDGTYAVHVGGGVWRLVAGGLE